MGSIIRRGRKLYLKWRDAAGIVRREVTSAGTVREAKLLLAEVETKVERQRLGLEALPVETSLTLGDLCSWWLESKCSENSKTVQGYSLNAHFIGQPIGATPLRAVSTEGLQAFFDALRKSGAAPATVNKLRGTLLSIYERARLAKVWTGPNPVSDVQRLRVPKVMKTTLRASEVPAFLANVPEGWRNLFAAALYTALRKGELCGLKKSDIDWDSASIFVSRSYGYDTTKGGNADSIPIAEPLLPYLRAAVAESPSEYVFPAPDGSMRSKESDPHKIVRSSLNRAGMVDGYRHTCRRCKAQGLEEPTSELHPDCQLRSCPVCGMKLWAAPVSRKMCFHDLRHTTATLLLRAGVDMHRVQRILRHANINTTIGTYGHLDIEDLRGAVEQVAPVVLEPARSVVEGSGPAWVQGEVKGKTEGRTRPDFSGESAPVSSGSYWDRTSDPYRVKVSEGVEQGSPPATTVRHDSRGAGGGGSNLSPPLDRARQHFGPPGAQHLRAVKHDASPLLKAKDVAARLCCSMATVYALIERGALPCSRVLNSIRVSEADLADFVRRGGFR